MSNDQIERQDCKVIILFNEQFIFKSIAVISISMLVLGFMVAGESTKAQNNASFSGVAPSIGQPKALFSGVFPTVGTNLVKASLAERYQ